MGLTTNRADEAQSFVDDCAIPWTCGYGVGSKSTQWAGVAPTVVVIGTDGHVLWQDDRARLRHETTTLAKDIAEAIELGLKRP